MIRLPKVSACLALALVVSACSHHPRPAPAAPSIAELRRRAAGSAPDSPASVDATLAELVAPGGSLSAATSGIDALVRARPGDPRVRFAEGLVAAQRGDFERALVAWCAAVEAGRTSADPMAPAIAEAVAPKLVSLRGDVRDFATPFRRLIDAVATDPGRLGAAAATELVETAVRWAREAGDREAAARWTAASGCVTAWTIAGPFGPLPMLRFDEALDPDGSGPLQAAYDLGPGRGLQPTYTVRARGCAANLGRGVTLTGVLYAATDFTLPREETVSVRVESPNLFAVLVDGVPVGGIDPRRSAVGAVAEARLRLPAGSHTLRIKVASTYHSPLVIATVTDLAGHAVATFSPAQRSAAPVPPRVLPVPPSPADDAFLPTAGAGAFERYVLAELAFSRRHPIAARELLRTLLGDAATPTTLIAWGSVAQADPFVPPAQARDRARDAFERAGRGDPQAYFPALALARMASEDERGDEALTLSRDAARRFPENPEVLSDLATRLMDRNWDGEARTLLDRVRERLPAVCWPVRLQLSLAQRHGDGAAESALADEIRRCDALSDAPASVALRMRRFDAAAQEYERLLADDPEGRGLRRAQVELLRASGRREEARAAARALLAEMPEDDALRADLADLDLATGRPDEARALLNQELARRPAELASLYRLRSFLAGREDLQPWRQDGRRVLRDFEASGHTYESAAVLVLDYTVRRTYPDGSALELTHNVVRVQTQEGADAFGEFQLPPGATLWRIRTLKADGRVLEPEEIAGKDSLSLPDLRPGDALEFEYVRTLPPSDAAPGGFSSDRFYFRGFEVPYDRTEYVAVVPREMELTIDPRGPAPPLARTERGGLLEYRWLVRHSDRMTPEPRSVAAREFIPSVAAGYGATWERLVDALRSRLIEQDPADPEAVALARRITRTARTPGQRLQQLHHWVLDNIQQEGSGTPFEVAPRMLAARAGHRTRVLCYLLKQVDVPCDIALVRQGSGDSTPSTLADDETYQSLLLRVRTEAGERWVTAADANAPTLYVPPATAGGEALLLTAGAPRSRVSALDIAAHGRQLTVNLALSPDGSGRATVLERLRGYAATGARAAMRRLDAANRDRQFEAYVGAMVSGATLESLTVEGTEDLEADMVFRYTFRAPGIARRDAGRLRFDGMFRAEAGRAYAELPERRFPQWNGDPVNASLSLTVRLPEGATVGALPADASEESVGGVRWSLRWLAQPGGFSVERRVVVPTGRVAPSDYPAFATALRALDTADTREVAITLRP
ncbi:MAG: tetratricopeptide repeat protein [Deltaproteobacteria bacterium]|nr:tetratricopeptide repeat protein [Myxococcales bacterium]MDP3216124.1 tetratricopeptide repeat protein [Deltaproteobacteria bacterium]